jgi:D-glycero-D-manno-heptose 1,7-bisphosphate phosphatase|tara:strand:+ start:29 stop:568 length:540 start_codon:yes stop_codon:yes gene_type:complete
MDYPLHKKTIFLDRDGVVNKEVNYLHKICDFKFIGGVFEACQYFQKLGYSIIIITNQSGIARNLYSVEDFQTLTIWMLKEFKKNGVEILDVFHCPHGPNSSCNCRKPKPGMLLEAKIKHKICMKDSWMIGDKETDIIAANSAGINNTILVKSGHKINEDKSNAKYIFTSIDQSIKTITD